ncbi:MAG: hypothetical protein U0573_02995 [Phycisphaerales bacterium]|nr:hypothetical protein [Planctomycetota bacterium]
MPHKHSALPFWIQAGIAGAFRSAITLPLTAGLAHSQSVARALGAGFAGLPFNKRHIRRAHQNLEIAFPENSREQNQALAVAAYEHLAQLGIELAFTPRLINHDGWSQHVTLGPVTEGFRRMLSGGPCVLVTGHCGNWELLGYTISMVGFPMQAVYRPLDLKPLDDWVRDSRQRRGLTLVSKFGAIKALPEGMKRGIPAGLVADQNGGDYGVFAPFFGRLTSTYKSIGILAMQFNANILCGMARRLAPGEQPPRGHVMSAQLGGMRYSLELTDTFGPQDWESQPDRLYYITARYRRALEMMIRSAPGQYLWMHRIWRSRPVHERKDKEFPALLRGKLEGLPWMTQAELNGIIRRSDLDRELIRSGADHGFRV